MYVTIIFKVKKTIYLRVGERQGRGLKKGSLEEMKGGKRVKKWYNYIQVKTLELLEGIIIQHTDKTL